MSSLPPAFVFSQSSLKDWRDCPRRFDLRYLQHLSYPAIEAEPALENERLRQRGEDFHRLVFQALSGIPLPALTPLAVSLGLEEWWQNWQEFAAAQGILHPGAALLPEATLSAPLAGFRLQAKFDLLMVRDGRACVFDWKTSARPPRAEILAAAMQTRVYRAVLVLAGAHLNGGQPFAPAQTEMRYWFAQFPQDEVRLTYSPAQLQRDLQSLTRDVQAIASAVSFERTEDENRCALCVYRSYCERGQAAALGEVDEETSLPDWDSLEMSEF